jgi:hypothetical protein
MTRKSPYCHTGQAQSHFRGLRPGYHYMSLQRLILDCMSCFTIGSPCWVQQNTLRPLSQLLRIPLIWHNKIYSGPSCTLWSRGYSHTSLVPSIRQLTRAFLISQYVIPYWTRGGTCYLGVSTTKIWSVTDSSNHMP